MVLVVRSFLVAVIQLTLGIVKEIGSWFVKHPTSTVQDKGGPILFKCRWPFNGRSGSGGRRFGFGRRFPFQGSSEFVHALVVDAVVVIVTGILGWAVARKGSVVAVARFVRGVMVVVGRIAAPSRRRIRSSGVVVRARIHTSWIAAAAAVVAMVFS